MPVSSLSSGGHWLLLSCLIGFSLKTRGSRFSPPPTASASRVPWGTAFVVPIAEPKPGAMSAWQCLHRSASLRISSLQYGHCLVVLSVLGMAHLISSKGAEDPSLGRRVLVWPGPDCSG